MISSSGNLWHFRAVAAIRSVLILMLGLNAITASVYLVGASETAYLDAMRSLFIGDLIFSILLVVALAWQPWRHRQPLARIALISRWCLAVGVFLVFQFGISVASQSGAGSDNPGYLILLGLGGLILLAGLTVLPLDLMRLKFQREDARMQRDGIAEIARRLERQEHATVALVEAECARRSMRHNGWMHFFRGRS